MSSARHRQLVFLEPSKVRNQHITMLRGLVDAHALAREASDLPPVRIYGHESLIAALDLAPEDRTHARAVPVMDPERRRLVRKSLLEALVTGWRMLRLRQDQTLLVTCLMPPALILVELLKRLLPSRDVVVMLHGEVEGFFEKRRQHAGSFGYYMLRWLRIRPSSSTLKLAVIDSFIADSLIAEFEDRIRSESVYVLPHPIAPMPRLTVLPDGVPGICFIGFNTLNKGYDLFERLAAEMEDQARFVTIGGGRKRVHGGDERALNGTSDYLDEIARCDVALFPYTGGYRASLSAAALDALSCGLHIVATRQACFVGLHSALGAYFVTLVDTIDDARFLLSDPAWISARRSERPERAAALERSHYGPRRVASALADLLSGTLAKQQRENIQALAA